jgi:hypothetical protein
MTHLYYNSVVSRVPTGQVPYREDPKNRKRRKEKERYAAMSQEKDELNRKRRERRKQKNVPGSSKY